MSVVAVKKDLTKISISADSILMSSQTNLNSPGSPNQKSFTKIFSINKMIIGVVGDAEDCGLMAIFAETHNPKVPDIDSVTKFIVEFRKFKQELGGNVNSCSDFILCYQGHVFDIQGLMAMEIKTYFAIGAGEEYAMAALYLGHSTEEAVEVTCDLCCYVDKPIITYTMDANNSAHTITGPTISMGKDKVQA